MRSIVDASELRSLLSKYKIVVVDFYATWCGPCMQMKNEVQALAQRLEQSSSGAIFFAKVDVDDAQELAAENKVKALPTFLVFENGAKLRGFVGAEQLSAIETFLKGRLSGGNKSSGSNHNSNPNKPSKFAGDKKKPAVEGGAVVKKKSSSAGAEGAAAGESKKPRKGPKKEEKAKKEAPTDPKAAKRLARKLAILRQKKR